MSAPSTAQVLENAARTASEIQRQARIRALDAGWRDLAGVGDPNRPLKRDTTKTRGAQ